MFLSICLDELAKGYLLEEFAECRLVNNIDIMH